jgi:tetratricopeptide (TPR) repeat protein
VGFEGGHRELWRTGDLDAFELLARHGMEAWPRAGAVSWLGQVCLGTAQFWKGHWQDASGTLECAIRSEPFPDWVETVWGLLFLVKAYARHADVLSLFASRRAALPSPNKPSFLGTWYLVQLGIEGLAVVGERREAHALYPTILQLAERRVTGYGAGLVQSAAGIAAACGGDWHRAEEHYQTALRQAHEIPHKIAQPEARRWYAQMLLDRNAPGDRDRARTLLGEAIDMYRTIGMPKHLELAERMRERLDAAQFG